MLCSSSRDAAFGGTKPVRIASLSFALRKRALRTNTKEVMSIPQGSTAWFIITKQEHIGWHINSH
jgi:hypothetical protein